MTPLCAKATATTAGFSKLTAWRLRSEVPYYAFEVETTMLASPIAYHRERVGLKREELALQCGLTVKYLGALERREEPRFTVRLRAMSHVLQVPVEELRP